MKVFVTVGNAQEPFDRLLVMVDAALEALPGPVEGLCQRGTSGLAPRRLTAVDKIGRAEFDAVMTGADVVICHAGVGTLATALRAGHRPIVLARRRIHREHVNDHQLDVLAQLRGSGDVLDAERGISPAMLREACATRRPLRTALGTAALQAIGAAMTGPFEPREHKSPVDLLRRAALHALGALGPRPQQVLP